MEKKYLENVFLKCSDTGDSLIQGSFPGSPQKNCGMYLKIEMNFDNLCRHR